MKKDYTYLRESPEGIALGKKIAELQPARVQDIARKLGISKTSVYRYMDKKDHTRKATVPKAKPEAPDPGLFCWDAHGDLFTIMQHAA